MRISRPDTLLFKTLASALLFLILLPILAACDSMTSTGSASTSSPIPTPATGPRGLPLYCPRALAIDASDTLYIADNAESQAHSRILKLSPAGQVVGEWHPFEPQRLGSSQGPYGITL